MQATVGPMQQGPVNAIARRLLEHVAAGTTAMAESPAEIDAARYVDPARHDLERERLFLRHPQVIALSVELASGAWLAQEVAGVPVLVVRRGSGELAAFVNACRHRGARVAEGRGAGSRLTCPYHGWSYDAAGRLVGIPGPEAFEGLDREKHGLAPLPVAEKYGLVFVQPTPGPGIDVDVLLGDLGPELEAFGLREAHLFDSREETLPINWKLANDTAMEAYHVAFLHESSVAPHTIPNTALYDRYGRNHRLAFPSPGLTDLNGQPEEDWDAFAHLQLVYNVFPSTGLVVSRGMLAFHRVDPGSRPGEAHYHFATYSHHPLETDEQRDFARLMFDGLYAVIRNEDFATMERVQRTLDAGGLERLVFGRNEPALHDVHRAYDELISA